MWLRHLPARGCISIIMFNSHWWTSPWICLIDFWLPWCVWHPQHPGAMSSTMQLDCMGRGKKPLPFVCLNLLYNNLILVLWVIMNNIYYSFSLGRSWFCGLCHNHISLCSLLSTTGVAVSLDKSPSYFCSSQWPGEGFFMPHLAPYITTLMMRRKAMVSKLCRMMQLSRSSSCAAAR